MQRSSRRRARVVLLVVLACTLAGLALAPAAGLPGAPARAIVPAGIAAAAGECEAAGLLPVGSTGLCTHGTDPVLGGDAVAPAEAGERSPLAVCTGNGTSGRRVQVLYARQSGSRSRYAEYVATFRIWAAETSQIYSDSAARAGGQRYVRFVHDAACVIDVKSVALPDAYADFGTVVSQLAELGYASAKRKYLVFLDASNDIDCGLATLLPDDQPGSENDNNNATGYALIYPQCWARTHILVHELGHTLGAVQDSAPHATGGSHCYDEWDAMCYDDGGPPLIYPCRDLANQGLLDCGNDDYFHPNPPRGSYLATHWNIARSGWLGTTGAPPATGRPPHDAIGNARVIDTLPFVDESDTLRATTAAGDPIGQAGTCWSLVAKTVWYRLKAPAGGTYTIETAGSGYNTVLMAFTGSPSRLRRLACHDDNDWDDLSARVTLSNVAAGTTIYLMVSAYPHQVGARPPAPGGYLRLSVTWSGRLALDRDSGRLGSSIPFTISGFPANADVAMTFDGAPLRSGERPLTVRTNERGRGSGAFRVPSAAAGAHMVGAVIGGIAVQAPFEVTPRIRLSPNSGGAATIVTVRFSGFQAGEPIRVRWRSPAGRLQTLAISVAGGQPAATVLTDANGSAQGSVTVPAGAGRGVARIEADGLTSGVRATAEFTVDRPPATATATATARATATAPPTATASPTATVSPTATGLPPSADEPTPTPTATPTPTEVPTETATEVPPPTPTDPPTPEPTPAPAESPAAQESTPDAADP